MQIFEPVYCLRPYVKSIVIVNSNHASLNRLLPGTSVTAAIRLRGNVHFNDPKCKTLLPILSISGLRNTYRMAEYDANSANLLVEFNEGGAAAFLDLPIHELFESNVALDQFYRPSELMKLQDDLQAQESMHMKVKYVQRFLISKLRYQKRDELITNAVEKIKLANGVINMKQLAADFYISQDAFEKRFRKNIGATPKQFSDIIRMKSLIALAQPASPLIDAALNAGFFDQSHFIRNFKKFTGQTPGDFFYAGSNAWSPLF